MGDDDADGINRWTNAVHTADARAVLDDLPSTAVHAVVTDPTHLEPFESVGSVVCRLVNGLEEVGGVVRW